MFGMPWSERGDDDGGSGGQIICKSNANLHSIRRRAKSEWP